jgi:hypothetical protein
MMENPASPSAVRRWFAGLVEQCFQTELGMCDTGVLDYLVDLLTDYIHVERISLLGDGSGQRVDDLAQMLEAALPVDAAPGVDRQRLIHRQIGDYTLFWTGVYPENLRRMHRRRTRDDLISFYEQGKRSYDIASRLSSDRTRPPAGVLRTLSEQFEYCVYGLGLVRKNWERAGRSLHGG